MQVADKTGKNSAGLPRGFKSLILTRLKDIDPEKLPKCQAIEELRQITLLYLLERGFAEGGPDRYVIGRENLAVVSDAYIFVNRAVGDVYIPFEVQRDRQRRLGRNGSGIHDDA